MTDTATTEQTQTETKGRKMAKRDVDYSLEIIDGELPERVRNGGGASSVLEGQLKKIVEMGDKVHGKWLRIGSYSVSSAATAAANVLRKRHGDQPSEGWRFETRRIDDGERTGVFANYDPSKVVDGAKEAWEAKMKEAAARRAEKAKTPRETDAKTAEAAENTPAAANHAPAKQPQKKG